MQSCGAASRPHELYIDGIVVRHQARPREPYENPDERPDRCDVMEVPPVMVLHEPRSCRPIAVRKSGGKLHVTFGSNICSCDCFIGR